MPASISLLRRACQTRRRRLMVGRLALGICGISGGIFGPAVAMRIASAWIGTRRNTVDVTPDMRALKFGAITSMASAGWGMARALADEPFAALTPDPFFFNDPATTEIYTYRHTLSLHDALPICSGGLGRISSWVTEAAPCRWAVPRQSAPVSPPPMITTCLPCTSMGDCPMSPSCTRLAYGRYSIA